MVLSPLGRPDARLVAAACRAGALGVLDARRDPVHALAAVAELTRVKCAPLGILVDRAQAIEFSALPPATWIFTDGPPSIAATTRLRTVAIVTSLEEAREAVEAGVDGLVAKGNEAGGRVGEMTSFVLLQQLAAEIDVPIWVLGGVGLHAAAACVAGGATGVVLEAQLALAPECTLSEAMRAAIAAMDGSETIVVGGHRILARPGLAPPPPEDASFATVAAGLGADDPATQWIPAGQDAAFARSLTQRFETTADIVHAIRHSISDSLRQARAARPLAPGSPLARQHGLRYPIFQGPMTRVSDRAAFADAVARGGGLPFLALALLRGDDLKRLLAETKEVMGDRPWGAGILGFVPKELREEQLAALEACRPPVALIAGGRPSQSKRLEELGTTTYLHVPSPGLLDLFLADGARRFVFEGRECGGHVGPRSSFALWDAQVERLLSFDKPEELGIVFAGGIHDARSAAMVAALAAPLAARGAAVGVLIGTAYLFTEEAVATGAIGAVFQREALGCARTVLLETAPGHATRCTESPWAETFLAERRRLMREGRDRESAWEELEKQNLGRLRVASKALRRDGDRLVEVDAETQRREGMFMIGQVAALRDRTCTIEQLHEDVSGGATRLLAGDEESEPARAEPVAPAGIAIVGMACVFPGARDKDEFWSNVVRGVDSVTEVPRDRWDVGTYHDPAGTPGHTVSKWGGFLPLVPFDPLRYGIPPRSLASIEPVQLLSLDVARRALEDAGYGAREFDRESTAVIFGAEAGTDLSAAYGFRAMHPQYAGELPAGLDALLPRLTEDSFPGVLANVISGRIANRLDLRGPNYTVDAACAASLAALDLAVKELTTGTSSMVLCGGADLHNSISDYLMFSSVRALSPTGRCRTFDASADGIVLAEGVACVVLKRLEDARRDGDRVYAVIEAVAGSSDGRCLGLTAPRREGQVLALHRAYRRAGLSPREVGLVEAHGTGTVVGDRTELETLDEVFREAGAEAGSCGLGSLKSQVGHAKCAAGLGGLMKIALALHHRTLPPTIHLERPNPAWREADSPFAPSTTSRPWPGARRHAAVSAFGFGGTNFHAVLAEGDESPAAVRPFPAELFLLRGADLEAARAEARRVREALARRDDLRLRDVAFTLALRGGEVQAAIVAAHRDELLARLDAFAGGSATDGLFVAGAPRGSVAFVFPGQGSQRPGMLGDLLLAFPALQSKLELDRGVARVALPASPFSDASRARQVAALTDTRVAQPALGMAGLTAAAWLASLGVRPDCVAGHSYGELVALCVAGAFPESELVRMSAARAACILEAAGADPGTMAAVSAPAAEVARALEGLRDVVVANDNAPKQSVISGPTAAIETACARLREAGLASTRIPVACAFHSPVVAGAAESFARFLADVDFASPALPAWSNVSASVHAAEPAAIRAALAAQVARPVRFREQVEAMHAAGVRIFVESGPGAVLTGLVSRILGDRPHQAIAIDDPARGELRSALAAIARLAVSGVEVDPLPLFEGSGARRVDLDAPAPSRATTWWIDGHRIRMPDGSVPENGLGPAVPPPRERAPQGASFDPVAGGAPAARGREGSASREQAVLEYLANVRRLAEGQRDVMLAFLGAEPAATVAAPPRVVEAPASVPAPEPPPVRPAASVEEMLVATVSEKTGYPREMLGLDLNLEAELSIDSIKRIEIVSTLADRFGLDRAGDERLVEELAACRTLRQMIAWFEKRRGAEGAEPGAEAPAAEPAAAAPAALATQVRRYVLDLGDAPTDPPRRALPSGARFAITDDGGGVARHLARLIGEAGGSAHVLERGEPVGAVAGLVHLGALDGDGRRDVSKDLFERTREALLGGATWVVGATALGGAFGRDDAAPSHEGGIAGLLKSLAKERPELRVRAVDVDPREPAEAIAAHLLDELLSGDDLVEVGRSADRRRVLQPVAASLAPDSSPAALGLTSESVVLVTGGARGITALVARALHERHGCRLVLVGRTAVSDGPEDGSVAAAADVTSLRRALSAGGTLAPREIEGAARRILREREIRANLAALRENGAQVSYHALDVRDSEAFGALIDRIYAEHGRLDGVIHGAGVIEDRLLQDKTRESFDRVYDTKVASARTLLAKLRRSTRFVVFFSSVAGAFGNRGQVDYAAANDALDKLALRLDRMIDGRVVSISWGPWAGAGMISPELEAEYARRGIGLIAPDEGVERLLDELSHGSTDSQVILTRDVLACVT